MNLSTKANSGLEMLNNDLTEKKVRRSNTNKMKWRVYASIILIVSVYLIVTIGVLTNNTLIRSVHMDNDNVKNVIIVHVIVSAILSIVPLWWAYNLSIKAKIDDEQTTSTRLQIRTIRVIAYTLLVITSLILPFHMMASRKSNQRPSVLKNDALWCCLCSIIGLIVLILMNAWAFRYMILFAAIVAPWVKRL